MTDITLNGSTFAPEDMSGYGFKDTIEVDGVDYPRWQGMWVAGLLEMANTAPLGQVLHPGFVSGLYYNSDLINGDLSNVTISADQLIAMPFSVAQTTTFDQLQCRVATGAPSSKVRMGVYSSSGGKPAARQVDGGELTTTADGQTRTASISLVLTPGWYWLVSLFGGGTPTMVGYDAADLVGSSRHLSGTASPFSAGGTSVLRKSQAYGALPANFPAVTSSDWNSTPVPAVFLRAA